MKTDLKQGEFSVIDSRTGQPVELALQELFVSGTILPVGAVLQVRHVFRSAEPGPLEVIYAFGLPRDAALRRFRIVAGDFSVDSELKPTPEAEQLYEAGIEAGSLSTLARQYRDGVINLNVGNIRPGETVTVYLEILAGVELRDDGLRFRFPFTLAPTYHAAARSVEAAFGKGEMELPEDFDNVVLPIWKKDPQGLHRIGFDLQVAIPADLATLEEIGSPSHAVRVRYDKEQHRVSLAPETEVPDRDLVLDIRTSASGPAITGGVHQGQGNFALVVPSAIFGTVERPPRRFVFVVDRSASMGGQCMTQARQAVEACLGALMPEDRFGIVAFDDSIETLSGNLLDGSRRSREAARHFLSGIDARGGTELAAGFLAAAKMLGEQGGDVLVLTDGQVSGTDQILASARAATIRIHCLGIGSASQDRFLTLLARETGGISRFVTPRERVDMAAVELFASIGCPLATKIGVEAAGVEFAPAPPAAVFAGVPLVLFGELSDSAATTVRLSWEGAAGQMTHDLPVQLTPNAQAEAVRLLQGSRLITDLEARGNAGAETNRRSDRYRRTLTNLSLKYGLASQAMSLVAVVKRPGDFPGDLPRTKVVPVGMPQDVRFSSYFNRRPDLGAAYSSPRLLSAICYSIEPEPTIMERIESSVSTLLTDIFKSKQSSSAPSSSPRWSSADDSESVHSMPSPASPLTDDDQSSRQDMQSVEDLLVQLAARIEPDGGMPGADDEERWFATAIVLLCLLEAGHTARQGAFRAHFARLFEFLKAAPSSQSDEPKSRVIEKLESGRAVPGDWTSLARTLLASREVDPQVFWRTYRIGANRGW